jgi:hypothetical protein
VKRVVILGLAIIALRTPQVRADTFPLHEITADDFLFRDYHIVDLDYALYGWLDTYPGQNQVVSKFFDGWASDYGDGPGGSDPAMCPCGPIMLPGGVFFDTDLFQLGYTNSVHLWWDFAASNLSLRQVIVQSVNPNTGVVSDYFYEVITDAWVSHESFSLTIREGEVFRDILFSGADKSYTTPETGDTLVYLCIGLGFLAVFKRPVLH